jgi:hypothetical protein
VDWVQEKLHVCTTVRENELDYTYVVSRLNIRHTTVLGESIVLYTGIPVDYKKELLYAFSDYVEAYEGTTITTQARSAACIALYPAINMLGSWVLWKIETRSRVRCSNIIKLVMLETIINAMNAFGAENQERVDRPLRRQQGIAETQQPAEVESETPLEEEEENQEGNQEETQTEDKNKANAPQEDEEEELQTQGEVVQSITKRAGRSIMRPSQYAAVTKNARSEWQEEATKRAIMNELRQLFQEMVAVLPVHCNMIPPNSTILKSHIFVVNKYLADGAFDTVKARLIADGRDQNPEMYPNKSSPTVAIHSVFMVLGLACQKGWQIVAKIDIKGAFVQMPMTGQWIFMQLDPKIAKHAKKMYPELDEYMYTDGCLYTIMLKAISWTQRSQNMRKKCTQS